MHEKYRTRAADLSLSPPCKDDYRPLNQSNSRLTVVELILENACFALNSLNTYFMLILVSPPRINDRPTSTK